ncbi:HIG1 domain family member 1A, mitochondrial-like [Athalia rosae]|uniref:HIG1 domain family member 1A, mitochondrial-like n=1 Tax=Athalia rosae TaxID=37344 RepID=UPI0020338B30|nr:HIG1 domain family member 1A, mitochondrial-like [Athalia rosae]XP_048509518.1 HIG1 domain family member 1A, mitochondrial-like [Athalia rosae]
MADQKVEIYDETAGEKLSRKMRESPFVVAGVVGLMAACGHGAYKYKHRGAMSTSVYLMQLRVTAQGILIGCITVGMAWSMFNQLLKHKKPEQ